MNGDTRTEFALLGYGMDSSLLGDSPRTRPTMEPNRSLGCGRYSYARYIYSSAFIYLAEYTRPVTILDVNISIPAHQGVGDSVLPPSNPQLFSLPPAALSRRLRRTARYARNWGLFVLKIHPILFSHRVSPVHFIVELM